MDRLGGADSPPTLEEYGRAISTSSPIPSFARLSDVGVPTQRWYAFDHIDLGSQMMARWAETPTEHFASCHGSRALDSDDGTIAGPSASVVELAGVITPFLRERCSGSVDKIGFMPMVVPGSLCPCSGGAFPSPQLCLTWQAFLPSTGGAHGVREQAAGYAATSGANTLIGDGCFPELYFPTFESAAEMEATIRRLDFAGCWAADQVKGMFFSGRAFCLFHWVAHRPIRLVTARWEQDGTAELINHFFDRPTEPPLLVAVRCGLERHGLQLCDDGSFLRAGRVGRLFATVDGATTSDGSSESHNDSASTMSLEGGSAICSACCLTSNRSTKECCGCVPEISLSPPDVTAASSRGAPRTGSPSAPASASAGTAAGSPPTAASSRVAPRTGSPSAPSSAGAGSAAGSPPTAARSRVASHTGSPATPASVGAGLRTPSWQRALCVLPYSRALGCSEEGVRLQFQAMTVAAAAGAPVLQPLPDSLFSCPAGGGFVLPLPAGARAARATESDILQAFLSLHAMHALGVAHGDARLRNVFFMDDASRGAATLQPEAVWTCLHVDYEENIQRDLDDCCFRISSRADVDELFRSCLRGLRVRLDAATYFPPAAGGVPAASDSAAAPSPRKAVAAAVAPREAVAAAAAAAADVPVGAFGSNLPASQPCSPSSAATGGASSASAVGLLPRPMERHTLPTAVADCGTGTSMLRPAGDYDVCEEERDVVDYNMFAEERDARPDISEYDLTEAFVRELAAAAWRKVQELTARHVRTWEDVEWPLDSAF